MIRRSATPKCHYLGTALAKCQHVCFKSSCVLWLCQIYYYVLLSWNKKKAGYACATGRVRAGTKEGVKIAQNMAQLGLIQLILCTMIDTCRVNRAVCEQTLILTTWILYCVSRYALLKMLPNAVDIQVKRFGKEMFLIPLHCTFWSSWFYMLLCKNLNQYIFIE